MKVFRYSLRAVSRSKGKSLLAIAVSLAFVLFLSLHMQSIAQHKDTLAALHDNITVLGQVTNYNGSSTENLIIPKSVIDALEASEFIAERYYSRSLYLLTESLAGLEQVELQNKLWSAAQLVGANSVQAIPEFSAADATPRYWRQQDENLFSAADRVCLLSEDLLFSLGLELGDFFDFTIAEKALVVKTGLPHGRIRLQVVGVFSGPARQRAYCSWDTINSICSELKIPPVWNSAGFRLQNTLRLLDFKSLLGKLNFLSPYETQATYALPDRLGFVINDRILVNAVSGVKGFIAFMTALYPVIYLLAAGIGFIVSYLLIRLRKPELALMRSLGASPGWCFANLFCEQVFLSLLGAVAGALLALLLPGRAGLNVVAVCGYLAFYCVGAAMAIATINRENVMLIFTLKE